MNSYFFRISEEEKADILSKQKQPYNGWTLSQKTENTSPLYVEDVAKDKGGFTLTNEDLNTESECVECGTMEGDCPECGGAMNENVCEACGYKTKDINSDNEFDYTEQSIKESVDKIKDFMNRLQIL